MPPGLDEDFVSEVSEQLDRLERLLAAPGMPDSGYLLRLSSNVRGSARRAGAETIASVAERLEDAARSLVTHDLAWSEDLRTLSLQTVTDLELLVRALNRWGQEEERRVRDAIDRWEDRPGVAGDPPSRAVPVATLFYDDEGPHIFPAEPEAVPIETLLFRGDRALEEARRLRPRFERLSEGADPALAELTEELFDLIELAMSTEVPEE